MIPRNTPANDHLQIFSQKIYTRYARSCQRAPHNYFRAYPCAPFCPATISRRACIDGTAFVAHLLRYLIRSPWISLSHAPSAIVSRRGAPTRIGLVLEGGRGVCAYFGDG